ncbi:MAG: BTAD domain-containing putative transcriptional regulator, partial [Pseudomonadota bacterium]
ETRERLVGVLWSESDETRARGSLRQVMTAFRRICGELGYEGFRSDRSGLGLEPELVRVDALELMRRLGPADVHPALLDSHDLPASMMRGCEDADPAFGNWLAVQRESLRARLLRGLGASLEEAQRAGEGGEDAARAILRLDPTHEIAARHVMLRRAQAGDAPGALNVYNALYRLLEEEHDIEPTPETVALVARIKGGAYEAPPRTAAREAQAPRETPRRRAPLLIVEPFRVEDGDPRAQSVLDGFRHRLIANLVRFREWRVAEGTERDPAPAPGPEGEDRFRVRALAEREGEGLALSVAIREEGSGVFVWSDRFALSLDNWREMKERLLRQVTVALNVNLSAGRLRRMSSGPELAPSLHELWLRGHRLINAYEPASWAEAERLFRRVTRAAPDYAPAWSALASLGLSRHTAHPGVMRCRAHHWRTLAKAQKAVELDPLDSRGQATLGWALIYCGRWEAGVSNFELALQLNNHDPWTVTSVAAGKTFAGRHPEVAGLAESVLETAEMSETRRWSLLAGLRFIGGDDEGALEAVERAGRTRIYVGAWRTAALARLGRAEEAAGAADRLRAELAGRWQGPGPAEERAMMTWLMHIFPMRREVDWRRLRDSLAEAGLAVDHTVFDQPGA